MSKRIIIFGTGGNCADILDTLNDINRFKGTEEYSCIGFLDDNPETWGKSILGAKVLGPLSHAAKFDDCLFVNGIGSQSNYWKKEHILIQTGISTDRFETIVHPSSSVSVTARLGAGTVIFQNVTITTNVSVGNHVVVLPNTVISHDSIVGDYSCITGGVCVSGGVTLGKSCYIGTNSSIRGSVEVGEYAMVGMGSVVLGDVAPRAVVVGSPARWLRDVFVS